jgi:uncharacterized protein (TIGR03437 family)
LTRGSLISLLVGGLPDLATLGDLAGLRVTIGGVGHPVVGAGVQNGGTLVQVVVSDAVAPGAQVPVILTYNGAVSPAFAVPVR